MANRLFFTGDTHGDYEIRRLASGAFRADDLDKDDYVVICGDFGLVFNPIQSSGREEYWLRWLAKKPFTTLFVDGNHENFDRLDAMETETWHGGKVHRINDSVFHLMRGEMFDIAGRKIFAMGGARSHDIPFRTEGISWWQQEMPSAEERALAWQTLERHAWHADAVVTHCAPANFQHALHADYGNDEMTRFLFDVERKLSYGTWLFGHYHEDRWIGERARAIYNDIVELLPDGTCVAR